MKTIDEIFNDVDLIGQTPNLILRTQIPPKIFEDVKSWVEPCRAIKDDEYSALLVHDATGYNTYQTSIPRRFIDNSFFLGYLIRAGELYLHVTNSGVNTVEDRKVHLRSYPGHFDGYDIWMNFTYKGDSNPLHNHPGSISGIIYVKDEKQPTFFPELNYSHQPTVGEMILFRSDQEHYVEEKLTEGERISISFNLDAYV